MSLDDFNNYDSILIATMPPELSFSGPAKQSIPLLPNRTKILKMRSILILKGSGASKRTSKCKLANTISRHRAGE